MRVGGRLHQASSGAGGPTPKPDAFGLHKPERSLDLLSCKKAHGAFQTSNGCGDRLIVRPQEHDAWRVRAHEPYIGKVGVEGHQHAIFTHARRADLRIDRAGKFLLVDVVDVPTLCFQDSPRGTRQILVELETHC